jgi:small subunit ribosomal protein S18
VAITKANAVVVGEPVAKLEVTDYHDIKMLKRFVSDTGKILPRRRTGVNAKNQRRLALTIKRARMLGLLPFTDKLIRK